MSRSLKITDSEIESSEFSDECYYSWIDTFSNKKKCHYLHQSGCIYLSLIIIQNGYMRKYNNLKKCYEFKCVKQMAFLKFGYTEVSSQNVYNRLKSQFREYDAIWHQPILVMKGESPSKLEHDIKNELREYNINIACSKKAIRQLPREFYEPSRKVLNIVLSMGYVSKFYPLLIDEDAKYRGIYTVIPDDLKPIIVSRRNNLEDSEKNNIRQRYNWK